MRKQLILWFLSLILLTVLAMGWRINSTAGATFRAFRHSHTRAHLTHLPQLLNRYSANHIDWDEITSELEEISQLLNMHIVLIDGQSTIRASTGNETVGDLMQDTTWAEEIVPLLNKEEDALLGYLLMARNQTLYEADDLFFQDLLNSSILTAVSVGLIAMLLSLVAAHSITTPLRRMTQATQAIIAGNYQVEVAGHNRHEIGQLGQAINHMAREIGKLEQVRRDLVMNVSHDFCTPLTVINGYLEALQSGTISDRRSAEHAFTYMKAEVDALQALIDGLNDVAALDSGQIPLNRQPTDYLALIQQAIKRVSWPAQAKDIQLAFINKLELSPTMQIDADKIGQVLFNLLDNSIHYTRQDGRIEITVWQQDTAIYTTITDNGEGIDQAHLPFIFERFYRAKTSQHRETDGYGMGLSIVQSITNRHGGSITAASSGLNQGTTFTLKLPISSL